MARGKSWHRVAEEEFGAMDEDEQASFADLYKRAH